MLITNKFNKTTIFLLLPVIITAIVVFIISKPSNEPTEIVAEDEVAIVIDPVDERNLQNANAINQGEYEYATDNATEFFIVMRNFLAGGLYSEILDNLDIVPDSEPSQIVYEKYDLCLYASELSKDISKYNSCRADAIKILTARGNEAAELLSLLAEHYPSEMEESKQNNIPEEES